MFATNPDVAFGDVVLSGGGPRGGEGANPGAGGWPTIRYYNKETGTLGKSYEKKTDMAMCSELGPEGTAKDKYLQKYIEEAGKTSLCSVIEPYAGCSDKEKDYIIKMNSKGADEVAKQLARLTGMAGGDMKPDLKLWLNQRLAILSKLSAAPKEEL
jgi:hypothetical protein